MKELEAQKSAKLGVACGWLGFAIGAFIVSLALAMIVLKE